MLRISKLTDYATVVLASLANEPATRFTAAEVAERTRLSATTVSKLLKILQRGGLVTSTRGSLGGYQLARTPQEISAASILDALEGPLALTECSSDHSSCGIEGTCRVGNAWQRVNGAIRGALNEISLAQLAGIERTAMRAPDLAASLKPTVFPLTRTRGSHE
jgi:FeS assembly SUF system regulator